MSQQTFRMFDADVFQKFLWGHTRPFLEKALEMVPAQVCLACHSIKIWLFPEMLADVGDRFCYSFVVSQFVLCFLESIYPRPFIGETRFLLKFIKKPSKISAAGIRFNVSNQNGEPGPAQNDIPR